MKTRELLTEWLEDYEKERVKARTYSRYEGLITLHILPELGDIEDNKLRGEPCLCSMRPQRR